MSSMTPTLIMCVPPVLLRLQLVSSQRSEAPWTATVLIEWGNVGEPVDTLFLSNATARGLSQSAITSNLKGMDVYSTSSEKALR